MFRHVFGIKDPVVIEVDGKLVRADAMETVASVLLRTPPFITRTTPVKLTPRAPYCMMGVCFECLAEIDGDGSVQTCQVRVRSGMRIVRPTGKRQIGEADV